MKKPTYKPGSLTDTIRKLYFEEGKSEEEIAEKVNRTKDKVHYLILSIQRRERKYQEKLRQLQQEQNISPEKKESSKESNENQTNQKSRKKQKKKDLSAFIPSEETYIPRKVGKRKKDIDILKTAFNKKQFALLVGETGTGKTHLVRHLASQEKMPYARINLNGGTSSDELIGHWVPEEYGGFRWQDGLLTTFVRYGGIIALDEVNACPPEILMALHSLTDDERMLVLQSKDGEVVKAHTNFYLVCTMNPDYEGTNPLNEAFKDRFPIKMYFDYSDEVEKKLIEDKVIQKLAKKLRKMKKSGEISTPVSTRQLIYFSENTQVYGYEIAMDFFLNNFEPHEKDSIRDVVEMLGNDSKNEENETLN